MYIVYGEPYGKLAELGAIRNALQKYSIWPVGQIICSMDKKQSTVNCLAVLQ